MKRLIKSNFEDIFGMTNLNPKKSNLPVIIWSDHGGIARNISHSNTPRVKIGTNEFWAVYTIESSPKLKSHSSNIKHSDWSNIQKGVEYLSRNYDLFLKHYNDTEFEFDDEDLVESLRERGEYK